MDEKIFWTIQAMMMFGGSFVKGLAVCLQNADRVNLAKIYETWPDYLQKYEALGEKMKKDRETFGDEVRKGEHD